MTDAHKAQIERINTISAIARTSWLALLGYLAFIGISLLAVEDADFFVPTRRTDLPLVGVAIPTHAFFLFAPILAAALYVYLHLHLLKLWDAIADAPSTPDARPLGEHLHPWIANDTALALKGCGALRPRPMRWLANLATRLLVWIAGPLVIAGFWWRSMPAHDEWLTLAIAAALLVTLYAGLTSWWTLRARLRFPSLPAHPWQVHFRRPAAIALALLVVVASWLRTEGGLDYYANRLVDLADATLGTALFKDCAPYDRGTPIAGQSPSDCFFANGDPKDSADVKLDRIAALPWLPTLDTFTLTHDNWLAGIWLDEGEIWNPLAWTDFEGDELVDVPETWRTPETARAVFRKTWCEQEGLTMAACGRPLSAAVREAARNANCGWPATPIPINPCLFPISDLEERFEAAWTEERASNLANLPRLSLAGRDLRNVVATQASLVNVDLSGARLMGSSFRGARLDGANLRGAQLTGADFLDAQLENADLTGARLDGARLAAARLESADLTGARLQRADLGGAHLEGAELDQAQLQGANLGFAHLQGANLRGADLQGAQLGHAQLEGADLFGAQLRGANLRFAELEGAYLKGETRLEGVNFQGADLRGAVLWGALAEGVDLRGADLRWSHWTDVVIRTAPAHSADFRGAQDLTQGQLDQMIGNVETLLPEAGNLTIPSCWEDAPDGFDALVEQVARWEVRSADAVRAKLLCPEGTDPQPTGTRLSVDAPYPHGHTWANRR